MIALWILAAIVALLGLALLLPLRITLRYTAEDGFYYGVRLLFFQLAASDRKKSEKKPAKQVTERKPAAEKPQKQGKSTVSALLSLLGLREVSTPERARAAVTERGFGEVLAEVLAAVKLLLQRTGRLLGSGVFERFELTAVIGGDDAADAAVTYGTACAAVYSLVTLLEQSMPVRHRRVAVEIDYTQEESRVRLNLLLRYRVWHLVRYACFLLGNYLKKEQKAS